MSTEDIEPFVFLACAHRGTLCSAACLLHVAQYVVQRPPATQPQCLTPCFNVTAALLLDANSAEDRKHLARRSLLESKPQRVIHASRKGLVVRVARHNWVEHTN